MKVAEFRVYLLILACKQKSRREEITVLVRYFSGSYSRLSTKNLFHNWNSI